MKRLAASIEVAGRGSRVAGRERGFAAWERGAAVEAAVRSYHRAVRRFADMPTLEVCYSLAEMDEVMQRYRSRLAPSRAKRLARGLAKARTRDNPGHPGRVRLERRARQNMSSTAANVLVIRRIR